MDAKYVGKTLPLPKEIHTKLEAYRIELAASLGFKVSLSDAIGHLLKNQTAFVIPEVKEEDDERTGSSEQV